MNIYRVWRQSLTHRPKCTNTSQYSLLVVRRGATCLLPQHWKMEAAGPGIQGDPQLHSLFGASVSYASKNDQTSRVSSNNSPCDKLQSSLSQNPSPSPNASLHSIMLKPEKKSYIHSEVHSARHTQNGRLPIEKSCEAVFTPWKSTTIQLTEVKENLQCWIPSHKPRL